MNPWHGVVDFFPYLGHNWTVGIVTSLCDGIHSPVMRFSYEFLYLHPKIKMKIAYFDCLSGISGDMTLGALVDAGVELDALNRVFESLGLPECRLTAESVVKKGIRATKVNVLYKHEHVHRHLSDITAMIQQAAMTDRQKEIAIRIFTRLAAAEAKVHGIEIEKVHFHEVGAADSIADIVCSAVGLDMLGIERIEASSIPTGCGTIEIAHGKVSIPAPATAELLTGIPIAQSDIQKELTTPTGAAILAELSARFGPPPAMKVTAIGYGAGTRDLENQANVLRISIGETVESAGGSSTETDSVCEIATNLDDCPGEQIGYCIERLWQAGALDVFTTAIGMKKDRPGVMLSVLCEESNRNSLLDIILAETTTIGVRYRRWDRVVLKRSKITVETPMGKIDGKITILPNGSRRFTPEYESCRKIAAKCELAISAVYDSAVKAYELTEK